MRGSAVSDIDVLSPEEEIASLDEKLVSLRERREKVLVDTAREAPNKFLRVFQVTGDVAVIDKEITATEKRKAHVIEMIPHLRAVEAERERERKDKEWTERAAEADKLRASIDDGAAKVIDLLFAAHAAWREKVLNPSLELDQMGREARRELDKTDQRLPSFVNPIVPHPKDFPSFVIECMRLAFDPANIGFHSPYATHGYSKRLLELLPDLRERSIKWGTNPGLHPVSDPRTHYEYQ